MNHNSLPRKSNFQRNIPSRRSAAFTMPSEPAFEYFIPRSLSEFDLSGNLDDNPLMGLLPSTVRLSRKNLPPKPREKVVTFEDEKLECGKSAKNNSELQGVFM